MANIFSKMKDYVESHKRNTFDLSFSNNLTFDFGQLVPVFCKEVIPGDSFKITPSFGLRLMPLVFPIQTRMNANLHFFYVRNRNLWKDWPDFIGRTKSGLVPPYLANNFILQTGSLGDYLGLPTTFVGQYGAGKRSFSRQDLCSESSTMQPYLCGTAHVQAGSVLPMWPGFLFGTAVQYARSVGSDFSSIKAQGGTSFTSPGDIQMACARAFISPRFLYPSRHFEESSDLVACQCDNGLTVDTVSPTHLYFVLFTPGATPNDDAFFYYCGVERFMYTDGGYYYYRPSSKKWKTRSVGLQEEVNFDDMASYLQTTFGSSLCRIGLVSIDNEKTEGVYNSASFDGGFGQFALFDNEPDDANYTIFNMTVATDEVSEVLDVSKSGVNPTADFFGGSLYISALPFRAYESIYNAFYRNQFNDPLIIGGQKEYNKFIRSNNGGADGLAYPVYKRNYELDFLTSAKQSPVDGDITPLVGVNAAGQFTFKNSDETTYTVTPVIGDDGHTLTGIESMEGTPENNSGLRRLVDMISLGISINDFRNVNALQRWLETNLRRGYRYKDQIMSHFGVDVKYEELDMPEFIGGMSEPVIVNQINQSVDQTGDPSGLGDFSKVLGSFAGQASILAQSKHAITKYCDEHGFIIGILSVTPVPCYSQLMPKYMFKDNVLDYYFPEFGHIGNQPITYKEVCPLQAYAAGDSLNDVFGYQRAWYDLIASVDEVHGDFRTSLNGFLITRLFNSKPELGKAFIEVNKDTMTNPFSVTDDTNKILGQLYFDVSAQRPIPKFGIPRLE